MALMVEGDDDLVAVDAYGVRSRTELRVYEASPGCDLELPLVPRAPHDARSPPKFESAGAHLDGGGDPAGAERCSAVGAAVGERVQLAVDPVEPDASAADLDVPYDALVRGLRERKTCLALRGPHDAGTGSRKNSCAFRQRTPSRHSAGSWRSVCSGSSKSQCGKSLA